MRCIMSAGGERTGGLSFLDELELYSRSNDRSGSGTLSVVVSLRVTMNHLAVLDDMVAQGFAKNRGEAIRHLIKREGEVSNYRRRR
jgi:hypothetical protein